MQTLTLTIQDDIYPKIMEFLTKFPTKSINIENKEIAMSKVVLPIEQKSDLNLNQHLNNYSTISSDKTDENWLSNVFSLMDKAFNESELAGQTVTERDWTRDEIYER